MWCALGFHRWSKWTVTDVKCTRMFEEHAMVAGRMLITMKPVETMIQRQRRECARCGLVETRKIIHE